MSLPRQDRLHFWQIAEVVRRPSLMRDLFIAAAFGITIGAAILISPLAALVLIVGLVAVYVIVARPMWVIYLLLVTIPLTSGMPRGQLLPLLKPNEAVLILALGTAFLAFAISVKKREIPGWVIFASLLLIAGTAITPVVSYYARGWSLDISLILRFVAPIQYLMLFWVFAHIPNSDKQRERVLQVIFLMASVVAVVGLLQAAQVPFVVSFLSAWYPSDQLDAAAQAGRVTSVFSAWNVLGTFLMFNLLLLTALQERKPSNRLYIWNMRTLALLSLFCLVATGSFASIFGLVFGFVLIKLFEPKGLSAILPFLLIGVIAIILLAPFLSTRLAFQFASDNGSVLPRTLVDRFDIWTGIYLPLIAKDPLWGVSPNMEGLTWGFAESEYINLLFRSGLFSLIAHFGWVVILLVWLRRVIRNSWGMSQKLAVFLFTLMATLSIMGITNPVFTYSGTIDYLWVLLGLTINAGEIRVHESV